MVEFLDRELKLFDLVWDIKAECFGIVTGKDEIYTNVNNNQLSKPRNVLLLNSHNIEEDYNKIQNSLVSKYKMFIEVEMKLKRGNSDLGVVYISNTNGDYYISLGKSNLYKDEKLISSGYGYVHIGKYDNIRLNDIKNGYLCHLYENYNVIPSKDVISFLKNKKANLMFTNIINLEPLFGQNGIYSWTFFGVHNMNNNYSIELLEYGERG